VMQVLN